MEKRCEPPLKMAPILIEGSVRTESVLDDMNDALLCGWITYLSSPTFFSFETAPSPLSPLLHADVFARALQGRENPHSASRG